MWPISCGVVGFRSRALSFLKAFSTSARPFRLKGCSMRLASYLIAHENHHGPAITKIFRYQRALAITSAFSLAAVCSGIFTASAQAVVAQVDEDDAPDEEGEPNEADETMETFSRLRAQILAEGDYVELDTDPVIQSHSLTWSTLHGPGRFEQVSMFYNKTTQELVGVFHFGEQICGHKSIVHGGAIAVAFDESLGWLTHIVAGQCFTAYLKVNYRAPLASSTLCVIRCTVRNIENRKIYVDAWLYDHLGKLHADANALFVVPKSYTFKHPPPVVTDIPNT